MEIKTIIIGAVILFAAAFFMWPDEIKGFFTSEESGTVPTFTVSPTVEETQSVPTEIPCSVAQDCVDYAREQGDTGEIDAECISNKCSYNIKKLLQAEG